MRWVRFSIVLLVVTVLNAGNLLNTVAIGGLSIKPDLLLIIMVFFAANCPAFEAIIASFAIGLAADISGAVMGPAVITFGILGSLISQMRKVIIMKRMIHQAFAIAITAMLAGTLTQILSSFKTDQARSNAFVVLFGTAIYSGIIGPLIWVVFSAMATWLGVRKFRIGRLDTRASKSR